MTTDIIERLRTSTEWAHCKHSMREEAAGEIERLRAALADMLKHFKQYEDAECCKRVFAQGRRALEPKP
jgi:hypothetical protein